LSLEVVADLLDKVTNGLLPLDQVTGLLNDLTAADQVADQIMNILANTSETPIFDSLADVTTDLTLDEDVVGLFASLAGTENIQVNRNEIDDLLNELEISETVEVTVKANDSVAVDHLLVMPQPAMTDSLLDNHSSLI
ncbi:hypothetical protein, partial [Acinetobacter rudis]